MKKFTHLLMMLCVFAGTAWAGPTDLPQITMDLENPVYYTISNTRSEGKVIYYTADGVKDENPQVLTDAHKFFFTGSSLSDVKIHNAEAEKSGLLFTGAGKWDATGVSCEICVTPYGDGTTGLAIKFSGTSLNEQNGGRNGYTTWSANDAGSVFVIDLVEDINWPEAEKFYTIEAPLFENVQGVKKGLVVDANGSLGWNTIDLTSKNCYWTVEYDSEKDGYAVKNLGTGKYLDGTAMSDNVANYAKFNYLSQCQFNIVVNSTTLHANNHGNGANQNGNIVSWGGSIGSASAWRFVEQVDPDAVKEIEITYNFTYNGNPVVGYTQTVKTMTGAEYPNVTVQFPFGVSATKPEGTIATEDAPAKTITIAVEENLPFKYAADANNIKNWYYIQQHSSAGYGKYLQYAETYIEWADATMTAGDEDTYTWAFVGNPFDGFKMVNYGAPAEANAVVSNGEGNPSFGAFDDAVAWAIKSSRTNKDAEHFCFQYPGSNKYMNAQSGKIAFWTDADQGSTMWVTERDFTGATELQALIDQVKAAQGNYVAGTTVGYLTQASVNAVAQAVTDAETYLNSGSVTAEKCAEHQTTINEAIAALETIQPEEGKFYTIQNAYSSVYMGVSNTTGMVTSATEGFGQVFQFVPASEGTFYLFNVERGAYLNTAKHHGYGQNSAGVDIAEAKSVTIANLGKENQVSITPQGGATLHHDANYATVVAWTGGVDSRSAWKIVEVEDMSALSHSVTITDAGWATLVLGCNTTIPADVKAYAVSAVGDGYATLAEVTTGTIPANEAVLLKAVEGTYEFKYAAESTPVENELVGTVFNTNVAANAYVLSKQNDEVGFYKAKFNVSTDTTNDGTTEEPAVTYEAFLNNAFKAYLPATTAESRFLVFNFGDDNATAIEGIEAENTADAVVYDLAGRRVQKAQKGLYIVNGKKVIK